MKEQPLKPRLVICRAKRAGLPVAAQHRRILSALVKVFPGAASYDQLMNDIRSRAANGRVLLATRITVLRKALRSFGYTIESERNLGYCLVKLEEEELRAA